MQPQSDMRARIVEKASQDADFRAQLLESPRETIAQELDITIPASLSIEVHEESGMTAHLVLPSDSRLNEGDLREVAGGGEFWFG